MTRKSTPTIASKSKPRKTKSSTPAIKSPQPPFTPLPAPPSVSPPAVVVKEQKVTTEKKSLEVNETPNTLSLDIYNSFSTKLPRISEIRRLHTEVEQIESRLMENRIEQQLLKEELAHLRSIFDPSKSVVDESYLRLSMVRTSLMQLIDDPDTKENHPLKAFVGRKPILSV
jgi:energy-converting hydrogenase A subunit M